MKPKLLQLFAINDEEPPDVGSDLLGIVEVSDGLTGKTDRMSHWLQHVHLLGSQKEINFDLLFIDIRFRYPHEPYAPQYGVGEDNPMGLLHALTFASRQDPAREPLVWGYHSAEPGKVCNDPIAIIAFSLLAALEQRGAAGDIYIDKVPWRWDDVGVARSPKQAAEHFSNAIANLPQGDAETIWKDMVERYRNKLLHYVKNEMAFIEYDDLEWAYQLACSNAEKDRIELAKISLRLSGKLESWSRVLLLQSLFADHLEYRQKSWPVEKVPQLKKYLLDLRNAVACEPPRFWVGEVEKLMVSKTLTGIKPKKYKLRVGTLGILCWWLNRKADRKPDVTVKQLLMFYGYADNSTPLTSCLKKVSGYNTLEPFLQYLEYPNKPLPPLLYEVGRYWWEEKLNLPIDRAPKCIQ